MNIERGIEGILIGVGLIIFVALWFYLLEIITNKISVRAGVVFGASSFILMMFLIGALS